MLVQMLVQVAIRSRLIMWLSVCVLNFSPQYEMFRFPVVIQAYLWFGPLSLLGNPVAFDSIGQVLIAEWFGPLLVCLNLSVIQLPEVNLMALNQVLLPVHSSDSHTVPGCLWPIII